jgi:hypothetical protein
MSDMTMQDVREGVRESAVKLWARIDAFLDGRYRTAALTGAAMMLLAIAWVVDCH